MNWKQKRDNLKVLYPDVPDEAFEQVEKDVSDTIQKIFKLKEKAMFLK